jgi:hypothetical protein
MRRLKIGYFPLSQDLKHPGDRRRVVAWAAARGHELLINQNRRVDVVLMSERSDYLNLSRAGSVPTVFDLVDGYLGIDDWRQDWAIGISKSIRGLVRTYPRSLRSILRETCKLSNLVICSSVEQRATILPFNSNVQVILDNHSEIPHLPFNRNSSLGIFWEGTIYTLGSLQKLVEQLSMAPQMFEIVTDVKYKRIGNSFFTADTVKRLNKTFIHHDFCLNSWSVSNLLAARNRSSLAVLPSFVDSGLHLLKPENRLLIMFKLGLPTLTSPIPSYSRIESNLKTKITCNSIEEWADMILQFQNNPEMAEDQVLKGQKFVEENHNVEILFSKWDKAFETF